MFQTADCFREGQAFRRRDQAPKLAPSIIYFVAGRKKKKCTSHQKPRKKSCDCEHIMAAQKALARSLPIKPPSEEASDSDSVLESSSQSSSDESSASDSLDSHASRKRRKISPAEVDAPLVPTTSVPSRIKSKIQDREIDAQTNNGAILAPLDSTTTFSALNVKPWLVGALGAMAIKRPTGIQKGCIPEILKGRDCIGGSRTGSGKTVAFAVPILQKWAEDPFGIFALVLTPTRYGTLLERLSTVPLMLIV
jgi:ATP-dependent RNA helicase DDX49/DBP8